jgi:hypothetical protein
MTTNALRFSLSAVFLLISLPWIPAKYLAPADSNDLGNSEHSGDTDNIQLITSSNTSVTPQEERKSSRLATLTWLHSYSLGHVHRYYEQSKKTALFWGLFLGKLYHVTYLIMLIHTLHDT